MEKVKYLHEMVSDPVPKDQSSISYSRKITCNYLQTEDKQHLVNSLSSICS